jgi:hypothetical protein
MDNLCKNLITGVLNLSGQTRKDTFVTDIYEQSSNNNNLYSFKFHTNDHIAIKITYVPQLNVKSFTDNTPIKFTPRSYKIFLKVI